MPTVMLYLYRHHRGEEALEVNTCFDGRGVAIAAEQVINVEWPNVGPVRYARLGSIVL